MREPDSHPRSMEDTTAGSPRDAEMQALDAIIRAVSEPLEPDAILRLVLQRTLSALPAEAGHVFLPDAGTAELRPAMHEGESLAGDPSSAVGDGPIGQAAASDGACFYDIEQPANAAGPDPGDAGFMRLAAVPLLAG